MGRHIDHSPDKTRRALLVLPFAAAITAYAASRSHQAQAGQSIPPVPEEPAVDVPVKSELSWHQLIAPKPKPEPSKRQQLLTTARSLFGIKYTWGGNTPATGLDCSGYTRLVYKRNGLSLPRVADDQYRACFTVRKPRPGDLVFFFNSLGIAHHVGIYVSDGYMYDAPHRGSTVGKRAIWRSDPIKYGRHHALVNV